ncbi:hypothetical protein QFC22_006603 [Naganishia vaughanmartiniae]|uniref:Uncharacterized protein n=1 Tax=Naganishia vaughanmartiniae TaxID=1424756 RepID=A0ACC2WIJ4_9TREE|nr:hypothetical protein QFC22_006603 [Naganishia vaughanmartiniae]
MRFSPGRSVQLARLLYQVPSNEHEKEGDEGKMQDETTSVSGAETRSNMSKLDTLPDRTVLTMNPADTESTFPLPFSERTTATNPSTTQTASTPGNSERGIKRAIQRIKELGDKMRKNTNRTGNLRSGANSSAVGGLPTKPSTAPSGSTAPPP